MRIVVIPARGGSKRIPGKNIKDFCGKPMIAWSIETALSLPDVDHVIVSTDSEEIKKVALDYGAEVPFMRPAELSDDFTVTMLVLKHAVEEMERQRGKTVSTLCCLYPTAPFAKANKIQEGFTKLEVEPRLEVAFSITSFPFPIQRAVYLREDEIVMVQPEYELTRSQDLEETYHDAGQFYCLKRDTVFQYMGFFSPYSKGIILPRNEVQDIDTLEDWEVAERMFHALS